MLTQNGSAVQSDGWVLSGISDGGYDVGGSEVGGGGVDGRVSVDGGGGI